MFKKSRKLRARILVPKSSKYIPNFHKNVFEILSLEIKPNLFDTHCSLKLSFTCRVRRVNAMFFLRKIDDYYFLHTKIDVRLTNVSNG